MASQALCVTLGRTLRTLANILNVIELLGIFPTTTQNLLVALIGKDSGGHRPIGLFRALFRVWAKARQHVWAEWERKADPDHIFGAGANRGATDIVWRQAFRNEVACASDEHAISVLIDLAKCYEHVRHIRLALEAKSLDFPMVLLRITIRAYEWARKLTIDKRVCADVLPSRGIIAGCASATTELKAFMYRSCSCTALLHLLVVAHCPCASPCQRGNPHPGSWLATGRSAGFQIFYRL